MGCDRTSTLLRRSIKSSDRFENTCAATAGRVERGTSDCRPGLAEQGPDPINRLFFYTDDFYWCPCFFGREFASYREIKYPGTGKNVIRTSYFGKIRIYQDT